MARRQVEEVKCDRCDKVELREIQPDNDPGVKRLPALVLRFQAVDVSYQDLCGRCTKACENYVASLIRKGEEKSEEPKAEEGTTNPTNSAAPQKTGFLGFSKKVG